ncbi:MAG: NAD-dependent epimerase/dehydratase family protein, partial [Mesorhizobium sp.]
MPAAIDRSRGCKNDRCIGCVAAHGRPAAVYHLAGGATVGQSIADPLKDFEQSVVSAARVLDFLRRHAPDAPVVLAS